MKKQLQYFLIFLFVGINSVWANGPIYTDIQKLKEDLEIVLPLLNTVKLEYEVADTHLQTLNTTAEKAEFMNEFENFIKDKYFDELFKLKLEQGKLLLLLIHKELGKTPYELLSQYRNPTRAIFWQRFAWFFGADLKEEYSAEAYPQIENELRITLYNSKK